MARATTAADSAKKTKSEAAPKAVVAAAAETSAKKSGRGLSKTQEGIVKSNKMAKSVVVLVQRHKRHADYGKYIKRTKKYVAHDEKNECQIGDQVRIVECRPLSKTKRWRVQSILARAV